MIADTAKDLGQPCTDYEIVKDKADCKLWCSSFSSDREGTYLFFEFDTPIWVTKIDIFNHNEARIGVEDYGAKGFTIAYLDRETGQHVETGDAELVSSRGWIPNPR